MSSFWEMSQCSRCKGGSAPDTSNPRSLCPQSIGTNATQKIQRQDAAVAMLESGAHDVNNPYADNNEARTPILGGKQHRFVQPAAQIRSYFIPFATLLQLRTKSDQALGISSNLSVLGLYLVSSPSKCSTSNTPCNSRSSSAESETPLRSTHLPRLMVCSAKFLVSTSLKSKRKGPLMGDESQIWQLAGCLLMTQTPWGRYVRARTPAYRRELEGDVLLRLMASLLVLA